MWSNVLLWQSRLGEDAISVADPGEDLGEPLIPPFQASYTIE